MTDTATDEQIGEIADDLAALASRRRLRLLHLLTEPRYSGEAAKALGVARQTAVSHIERLESRGFVRALAGRRSHGPVKEYRVVPARLYATAVSLGHLARLRPSGGPAVEDGLDTLPLASAASAMPQEGVGVTGRRLVVASGPRAGQHHPLAGSGQRWVIGRAPDAHVCLDNDPFVSTRHAEVRRRSGHHVLVDAGSSNGTHVNFQPLPSEGRTRLRVGDVVRVGHTVLVYQES